MAGWQPGRWGASKPGHRVSLLREERRAGGGGRWVRGARNAGNQGLRGPRGRSGSSPAETREAGVPARRERERGRPSPKEGCVTAHRVGRSWGLGVGVGGKLARGGGFRTPSGCRGRECPGITRGSGRGPPSLQGARLGVASRPGIQQGPVPSGRGGDPRNPLEARAHPPPPPGSQAPFLPMPGAT